jgi:hypothetical protein
MQQFLYPYNTLGGVKVITTKREAATRQLDVAIGLLFTDGDPLAVRTLAGAAYGIFADLAEHQEPGASWRAKVIEESGLSVKAALGILNAAQNYLKHADCDPDGVLAFEESDNDHLIFVASLECGGISHPLSFSLQAFQIWYLAMYPEKVGRETEPVRQSVATFPGLSQFERPAQLKRGHQFLELVLYNRGLL